MNVLRIYKFTGSRTDAEVAYRNLISENAEKSNDCAMIIALAYRSDYCFFKGTLRICDWRYVYNWEFTLYYRDVEFFANDIGDNFERFFADYFKEYSKPIHVITTGCSPKVKSLLRGNDVCRFLKGSRISYRNGRLEAVRLVFNSYLEYEIDINWRALTYGMPVKYECMELDEQTGSLSREQMADLLKSYRNSVKGRTIDFKLAVVALSSLDLPIYVMDEILLLSHKSTELLEIDRIRIITRVLSSCKKIRKNREYVYPTINWDE